VLSVNEVRLTLGLPVDFNRDFHCVHYLLTYRKNNKKSQDWNVKLRFTFFGYGMKTVPVLFIYRREGYKTETLSEIVVGWEQIEEKVKKENFYKFEPYYILEYKKWVNDNRNFSLDALQIGYPMWLLYPIGDEFCFLVNPNLTKLGMSGFMDPYELYSEIDHTISNVLLKENTLENNMSDKEKIISHGFDLKNSFRKVN
jgi:hypothetical protein